MIRNQYLSKYITSQCSKLSPYFSPIHNGKLIIMFSYLSGTGRFSQEIRVRYKQRSEPAPNGWDLLISPTPNPTLNLPSLLEVSQPTCGVNPSHLEVSGLQRYILGKFEHGTASLCHICKHKEVVPASRLSHVRMLQVVDRLAFSHSS